MEPTTNPVPIAEEVGVPAEEARTPAEAPPDPPRSRLQVVEPALERLAGERGLHEVHARFESAFANAPTSAEPANKRRAGRMSARLNSADAAVPTTNPS